MQKIVRIRRRVATARPSSVADGSEALTTSPLFSRLEIVYKNIGDVKPSPHRVRRRKKGQLEAFIGRLRRFGLRYPILITEDGEIVDGHLLYEALLALGETQMVCPLKSGPP